MPVPNGAAMKALSAAISKGVTGQGDDMARVGRNFSSQNLPGAQRSPAGPPIEGLDVQLPAQGAPGADDFSSLFPGQGMDAIPAAIPSATGFDPELSLILEAAEALELGDTATAKRLLMEKMKLQATATPSSIPGPDFELPF